MSALATLACCLPLGIAGALGALGLSVVLDSLRPWLLGFAVVLLGIGFGQPSRGQRICQPRSRLSLVLLIACTAIVLATIAFPQTVAELMADYLP